MDVYFSIALIRFFALMQFMFVLYGVRYRFRESMQLVCMHKHASQLMVDVSFYYLLVVICYLLIGLSRLSRSKYETERQ